MLSHSREPCQTFELKDNSRRIGGFEIYQKERAAGHTHKHIYHPVARVRLKTMDPLFRKIAGNVKVSNKEREKEKEGKGKKSVQTDVLYASHARCLPHTTATLDRTGCGAASDAGGPNK